MEIDPLGIGRNRSWIGKLRVCFGEVLEFLFIYLGRARERMSHA